MPAEFAGRRAEPKVLAVVLTYDAPGALMRCLEALNRQTCKPDSVLVVDNAGSNSAEETIRAMSSSPGRLHVLRLPENRGPAGGHAAGLREFLVGDHDAVWIFDDDVEPEESCLERLLAHMAHEERLGIVRPTQLDPSGRTQNFPGWFGVLIPRQVVEAIGLPLEELVWWTEDTEYLKWRVSRAGFPVVRVPEARVRHFQARRSGGRPGWKVYYETRNTIFYRLHIKRSRRYHRLVRVLTRSLLSVMREGRRRENLWMFARGVRDGVQGRLGMNVPLDGRPGPSSREARM